jgi:hypothetical protein
MKEFVVKTIGGRHYHIDAKTKREARQQVIEHPDDESSYTRLEFKVVRIIPLDAKDSSRKDRS